MSAGAMASNSWRNKAHLSFYTLPVAGSFEMRNGGERANIMLVVKAGESCRLVFEALFERVAAAKTFRYKKSQTLLPHRAR